MSPAGRLLGYLRPYAARYSAGVGCLALAFHAGVIVLLAALHALARLGSRFTTLGAGQWVEHDVRRDLYAHLETLAPAFYLRHGTGDLMSRAVHA